MTVMRPQARQRGVSLVEACITMAMLAVVVGSTLPTLRELLLQRALFGRATELTSDLQFLRSEALARNRSLRVSFQTSDAGSCYVLHSGPPGRCDCLSPGTARCGTGAQALKSVFLPASAALQIRANVGSVLFDPLHGTSSPAASVQVGDRQGHVVTHAISVLGRVRSCAPQLAVTGFVPC